MMQLDVEIYALKKRIKELQSMGEHAPESIIQEEMRLQERLKAVKNRISEIHAEDSTVLLEPLDGKMRYTYFKQNKEGATLLGVAEFSTTPKGQTQLFEWSASIENKTVYGIASSRKEARDMALDNLDVLLAG